MILNDLGSSYLISDWRVGYSYPVGDVLLVVSGNRDRAYMYPHTHIYAHTQFSRQDIMTTTD